MSLSSASARAAFASTRGEDPLFADVDGANCPGVARGDAMAHSLLTGHGLIRIALPVLEQRDYTVQTIYDPYGCADVIGPRYEPAAVSEYRGPCRQPTSGS